MKNYVEVLRYSQIEGVYRSAMRSDERLDGEFEFLNAIDKEDRSAVAFDTPHLREEVLKQGYLIKGVK